MKLPTIFLCLLFIYHIKCDYWEVLDEIKESKSSEENDSSEEKSVDPVLGIKNGNSHADKEDNSLPIFKECKDSCLFEAARKNIIDKTSDGEACLQGCQAQYNALLDVQTIYKNTSPDLLLGSAIDKCWEGCAASTNGQSFCISGCDKMRNLQKKMMKTGDEDDIEHIEQPEDSFENEKKSNVDNLTGKDDDQTTWTYYLLSPGDDGLGAFRAYMNIMNIMDNMFREMDTLDMDASMDTQAKGWRGDQRQLNLPQYSARTSALTDDNDYYSKFYNEVSNSLSQIKKKVQDTVSTPGFKEYLFYILFCISGIMLIQSVFNILLGGKEPRQTVDHFYLPPAGPLPPKLPSYDECMKDSQKLCVGLTEQESICKMNLSLPVVSLPLAKGIEKETAMEDVDLKQDSNEEKA